MKRKLPKWSGVAALVLLAGALGVLAWQGSRHLTAASGNTPALRNSYRHRHAPGRGIPALSADGGCDPAD